RNIAVQTIKSCTRGPWGDKPHTSATWYEPFTEQSDIDRAVWWVLRRPRIFLNTPGDIHVLPKVLDAASRLDEAPTREQLDQEMAELEPEPLFA
ncbi:MAG TPA: hypothetical protein VE268_08660, partial [Herpetosiphonaceae bacterium]|nr:hypothetical protein [Herpetosiphonaceae bacterium]